MKFLGEKLTERLKKMSKYLLILFLLVACEDRYRYTCQNPDNFNLAECQKPRCLFTQTCPEYLVAPILEKQIERPNNAPTDTKATTTTHDK